MQAGQCIYCKRSFEEIEVSKSDIIPDFFANGLMLEDAVCKECNNAFNSSVENPLRHHFQYLRKELYLEGRRGIPVKVDAEIEIDKVGKTVRTELGHLFEKGIRPFTYTGEDGKEYYSVIGNNEYVEEMKDMLSRKKPNIEWKEREEFGVKITFPILPYEVMYGEKGKRLAAKITFERLCQKLSAVTVLDGIYDDVRKFIKDGTETGRISTLMYNERIMMRNLNIPFPSHCIVLTKDLRNNRVVGVVTLFGLYYYLVILANYLTVKNAWDDCVVVHPQQKDDYEPVIRDSFGINIPEEAWYLDEEKFTKAREFGIEKLKTELQSKRCVIGRPV